MKVLVITYLPWRNDYSVGNTLSNIFSGLETEIEFGNIFFRDSLPNNNIISDHFKISEKKLAKSIITRKSVGERIFKLDDNVSIRESFSPTYNKTRQLRWDLFLLIQDCIGIFGVWKSKALYDFITDFKPDLIFGPLGRIPVTNNLMSYIGKRHKIPLITYPWDDHYSLKKLSFSPIFWLKTFVERKAIKKCAMQSEFLYTVTKKMKDEYSIYFNKKCKLLYKGYNFENEPPKSMINNPIKIIYMGNIGDGRWGIIAKVASSLYKINKETQKAILDIYTLSPISDKMRLLLEIEGSSSLKEPVASKDILKTMQSADILLFVEPTKLKQRLFFRLSFSTKLVDYFYNAKCILALGGITESMNYLKNNDAAIVEFGFDNIERKLAEVINNNFLIETFSKKAWDCGFKNHQISNIQDMLLIDFKNIIERYKCNEIC